MVPMLNVGKPEAIEFEAATKSVIYVDAEQNLLNMAVIDSVRIFCGFTQFRNCFIFWKVNTTKILLRDVESFCLCLDWTTGNLYLNNMKKGWIGVVQLANSTNFKTLFWNVFRTEQSYMALDPVRGIN